MNNTQDVFNNIVKFLGKNEDKPELIESIFGTRDTNDILYRNDYEEVIEQWETYLAKEDRKRHYGANYEATFSSAWDKITGDLVEGYGHAALSRIRIVPSGLVKG